MPFVLKQEDKLFFIKTLIDFYRFYEKKSQDESEKLAVSGVENLIEGKDLQGVPIDPVNLTYFDPIVQTVTKGYYQHLHEHSFRYPFKKSIKSKKAERIIDEDIEEIKAKKIKENLLSEYPFLNRRDLEDTVNNYCVLAVRVNKLLTSGADANNVSIKNLTETQIKLGQYLGVSESDRQKMQRAAEKDSISELSLQFQQTLDEFPELYDRLRYQEVKILLEKVDRHELPPEMFMLPSFTGMTVDEARSYVREKQSKYDS